LVIPSCAVVVIRDVLIKVFACVAQVGLRCYSSIIAERYAVSIVIMDIGNAGGVQYLPCRAVPIVKQVLGCISSIKDPIAAYIVPIPVGFCLAYNIITDGILDLRFCLWNRRRGNFYCFFNCLCVAGRIILFSKSKKKNEPFQQLHCSQLTLNSLRNNHFTKKIINPLNLLGIKSSFI